ncbi:MAG: CpXC protein [Acidobacteriota bacterium]|nr:CpXC protein [Acidobacteriota bacterium]
MLCPNCGAEMNHHADKIDYNAGLDEPDLIDEVFGGVLEEAHTCPHCGHTEVRAARAEGS